MKAKRKPFVCGQKLLGKSEVFTMPCDCEYGTCNDGLMEVWEKGKKSVVFTRCMLKNSYEQGKKDADGIKATLLIERDKKARKQTFKEVLKEYKKLIDEAPTISHKDSIDFGCWLEQKIKELSK